MRTIDASYVFISELYGAYVNVEESAMINKSLYGSCRTMGNSAVMYHRGSFPQPISRYI